MTQTIEEIGFENVNEISRRALATLFYPGRKLRLIDCYTGRCDQPRTVVEQKSFGYVMARADGKQSEMRFKKGDYILAKGCGNGYYEVSVIDSEDRVAAKYELL
jgi:hypothetical protein